MKGRCVIVKNSVSFVKTFIGPIVVEKCKIPAICGLLQFDTGQFLPYPSGLRHKL